jgi:hypothetical protein
MPFADEWAAAEPDLDAEMGDEWRLLPRAAPAVNARPVTDPLRPPVYFTGRLRIVAKADHPQGRNKPTSSVHGLSGMAPILALSGAEAEKIRCETGGDPKSGDLVARISDETFYRVELTQNLDLGMVELTLAATNPPALSRTAAEPVFD